MAIVGSIFRMDFCNSIWSGCHLDVIAGKLAARLGSIFGDVAVFTAGNRVDQNPVGLVHSSCVAAWVDCGVAVSLRQIDVQRREYIML